MVQDHYVNVDARSAITIVVLFFLNGIRESQTAVNLMEGPTKVEVQKNSTIVNHEPVTIVTNVTETAACPHDLECAKLQFPCIKCNYNTSCLYGQELNVFCEPNINVQCSGERSFVRSMKCKYCYQTELWQYNCIQKGNCNSMDQYYKTNCTVHEDVLCLGKRTFYKNVKCNWTQGYKWSTALLISLALGGFGADRFYLGHWQEGIGKLFSFGGLGVWTIIDVVLISLHYLGPADGSLYI